MAAESSRRAAGRPREFSADDALEAAMRVFWRQGYEGTSLSDLTAATGLNRPSLYAAFGNKQAFFRAALDRYADTHMAFMRRALEEPTARKAVEAWLRGFVASATDPRTPAGCLTVGAALTRGPRNDAIHAELTARRAAGETSLRTRLARARTEGDLPSDADPADLARFVSTLTQGIAVQATGGAARAQLNRVVDLALNSWPR
jgi:AcrR family transcriptional regulator